METVSSSEMLLQFYQTTLEHIPENIKYVSSILNTALLFLYNKADKIDCICYRRVPFRSDMNFIRNCSSSFRLFLRHFQCRNFYRVEGRTSQYNKRVPLPFPCSEKACDYYWAPDCAGTHASLIGQIQLFAISFGHWILSNSKNSYGTHNKMFIYETKKLDNRYVRIIIINIKWGHNIT